MDTKEAKILVDALKLPEQTERLAEEPRYRDIAVIDALLPRIEALALADPPAAVRTGEIVETLMPALLPEPRGGAALALLARTRATLAAAYRTAGRLGDAARLYREILEVADSIPRLELAMVLRRYAGILRLQEDYPAALEVVERALKLHRELRSGEGLALVSRGGIHLERSDYAGAMTDFTDALPKLSPSADRRHYLSTLAGLAVCAIRAPRLANLGEPLAKIRQARRAAGLPSWSVPALKLRWIEGLIQLRLGSTQRAEKQLRQARAGLLEIGLPQDAALVTLDLAGMLAGEGRLGEARALVAEVLALAAADAAQVEASLAALQLWSRAEEPTFELLRSVREKLLALPAGRFQVDA